MQQQIKTNHALVLALRDETSGHSIASSGQGAPLGTAHSSFDDLSVFVPQDSSLGETQSSLKPSTSDVGFDPVPYLSRQQTVSQALGFADNDVVFVEDLPKNKAHTGTFRN